MKELNRFRQFLNESQEVKEGTWGYGSKDQMVKTLAQLDKISQMGGVKGSLELDKIGDILYNVFGDDSFHDAIDRAKDSAIDDDRFSNAIGDAQARGIEMMNAIYRTNEEMDVNIDSPKEDAEIGMTLPEIKGKDEKTRKLVTEGLFILLLLGLGAKAGGEAFAAIKKSNLVAGGVGGLKAALKGRDIAHIIKDIATSAV